MGGASISYEPIEGNSCKASRTSKNCGGSKGSRGSRGAIEFKHKDSKLANLARNLD